VCFERDGLQAVRQLPLKNRGFSPWGESPLQLISASLGVAHAIGDGLTTMLGSRRSLEARGSKLAARSSKLL
jgi:hypothetical protein